jgi:polyisoprenoid-binding protein YceI
MKKVIRSLTAVTALALSLGAQAELGDMPSGAYVLDKAHGYITFTYDHLGFSTPHVGFRNFDVSLDLDSSNIENSNVEVLIDATSIDSRVDVFNGHLNGENFFDTANHPEITFTGTDITSTGGETFDITGDLTIKGVTKSVTLNAILQKADMHPMRNLPSIGVTAEGTLSRSDFGLTRGVPNISDEVTLHISVEMPQKAED